jgi:O-antigen ligase
MLKISQFTLLFYVLSCYISPSLKTVFLISGIVTWILYLTGLYEKKPISYDPDYKYLNIFLLVFIMTKLFVYISQGQPLGGWVRSIFSSFIQWFWFASVLLASMKQDKFFKKFGFVEMLKIVFVSIGVFESIFILLQLFGIIPAHGEDSTYGILGQPFTNAGLLLASSFVTASIIKKDSKSIWFVLLLLQLIAIIILGQISVICGLFVGLLMFMFFSKAFRLKQILAFIVLAIATFGFASLFSSRIERKLKWFTTNRLITNRSISCRYEIWKLNLEQFKKNPMLGNKNIIPYSCEIKEKITILKHAHNIYIQKLAEGGLVKFSVWFLFYIAVAHHLFHLAIQNNPAGLGFFLAISIEGVLENWWGDSEVLAIFLFMTIFAKYLGLKSNLSK